MPRGRPKKKAFKVEVEVVDPIDPEEDFSDVSGDPGNEFRLENADPTKAYIWAHHSREGVTTMQANVVGYTISHYLGDDWKSDDGENARGPTRPVGTKGIWKEGEEMVVRDHVLMETSRALADKRSRFLVKTNRERWNGKRLEVRDGEVNAADAAAKATPGVRALRNERMTIQTAE